MKNELPFDLNSGIYKLEWEQGYFYYGQTQNFIQRKSAHLSRLNKGTHKNIRITRLFLKYGLPKFIIIESCEIKYLDIVEQKYLDKHVNNKMCCNIETIANSGARGCKRSIETIERMRKSQFGKKLSKEHKEAIRQTLKLRIENGLAIGLSRPGEKNPYFGKKHSAETKEKMKIKKLETGKSKIVLNIETGIYYYTAKEAAKSIGKSIGYL
jgi:group I intron endonuclease